MKTNIKSKIFVILVFLLTVNIASTIYLGVKVYQNENKSGNIKYTLYIGLNDKDTYKQEIYADAEGKAGIFPKGREETGGKCPGLKSYLPSEFPSF